MNMSTTDTMASKTAVQEEMERGVAAAQAGDKASAHKIFQTLAASNAHMPELWVWIGGTSSSLDEAEAAFQRAVMLDPANEEANLGLRWVGLRRQVLGQADASDLSTGSFDRKGVTSTSALTSGSLNSSNLASSTLGTSSLGTGALKTTDGDKDMKVKVGKAGGRRMNIPVAAIFLFALSLVLYAIVAYFLIFK